MSVPGGMFASMGHTSIPIERLVRENHGTAGSTDLLHASRPEPTGCRRAHRTWHTDAPCAAGSEPRGWRPRFLLPAQTRPRRYAGGDRDRCSAWLENGFLCTQRAIAPRRTHLGARRVRVGFHSRGSGCGNSKRLAELGLPGYVEYRLPHCRVSTLGHRDQDQPELRATIPQGPRVTGGSNTTMERASWLLKMIFKR